MSDLKNELWARLRDARAVMLTRLDGLSEFDRRRPLTYADETIRQLDLDSPLGIGLTTNEPRWDRSWS